MIHQYPNISLTQLYLMMKYNTTYWQLKNGQINAKMKFNPLKSEALLISRGFDRTDSIFLFQNHTVQNGKEHNHLELIWNDNGSWKNHLSNIINKAVKRVDMMRALKYKLGRSALEEIYFAFIRPLFEYGCVVWDNAPRHEYLFNEMEKIQIQAARIITGTNNYAP